MHRPLTFALALIFALTLALHAASPEPEIRKALDDQVLAWNRGDIPAFMSAYDNSPNTLFIGKEVARGYTAVLERYRRTYSSKEKMGTLRFSDLEVRPLGKDHAVVVGRFHLDRTPEAGGESAGIFTLTFEKTRTGWKIIVDHTSGS